MNDPAAALPPFDHAGTRRRDEVTRRARERLLCGPGEQHAFADDPIYHASIKQLIRTVQATDEAMCAEDIPEDVRDRVLYRLLYGEPPYAYPVADFREGLERMRDRQTETLRLMEGLPVEGLPGFSAG